MVHILGIIAIIIIIAIVVRGMVREFQRINENDARQKRRDELLSRAADMATDHVKMIIENSRLREYDYRHLQNWVGEWSDRVLKPKGVTLQGTYKHLVKEVTELGLELDKLAALGPQDPCDYYNDGQFAELKEKIAKELVDIDIVTCHLGHQLNILLAPHFVEKMVVNENRSWHQADENGVSQHVEGTDNGTENSPA